MPNEIRPISPTSPSSETLPRENPAPARGIENSANQAQQEQSRRTQDLQKTQEMQEAQFKKAAMEALQKMPEAPRLAQDFLSLIESVVQEAYEGAGAQSGGRRDSDSAATGSRQAGAQQPSVKDLQMLREFMREANYLIKSQNMEITQMLNTIKVQQGGVFWQKLQEMLQKGIPASQLVLFQNVEKNLSEMSQQFLGMEGLGKGIQASAQEKTGLAQPGRAILEMVQAESNPQGAMEHYQGALQILMKDGLQVSAQKLILYLRKRSGLSEHLPDMQLWANELRKDIVAPQPQKLAISQAHWLSILLGALSFGLLLGLGQDWIASLLVGFSISVVIFLFSLILKK